MYFWEAWPGRKACCQGQAVASAGYEEERQKGKRFILS